MPHVPQPGDASPPSQITPPARNRQDVAAPAEPPSGDPPAAQQGPSAPMDQQGLGALVDQDQEAGSSHHQRTSASAGAGQRSPSPNDPVVTSAQEPAVQTGQGAFPRQSSRVRDEQGTPPRVQAGQRTPPGRVYQSKPVQARTRRSSRVHGSMLCKVRLSRWRRGFWLAGEQDGIRGGAR